MTDSGQLRRSASGARPRACRSRPKRVIMSAKTVLKAFITTFAPGRSRPIISPPELHREQFDEMPLRVEYSLTDHGKDILPLIIDIKLWAERNFVPKADL